MAHLRGGGIVTCSPPAKMASFALGVSTFLSALGLDNGVLLRLVLTLGRFLNTLLGTVVMSIGNQNFGYPIKSRNRFGFWFFS